MSFERGQRMPFLKPEDRPTISTNLYKVWVELYRYTVEGLTALHQPAQTPSNHFSSRAFECVQQDHTAIHVDEELPRFLPHIADRFEEMAGRDLTNHDQWAECYINVYGKLREYWNDAVAEHMSIPTPDQPALQAPNTRTRTTQPHPQIKESVLIERLKKLLEPILSLLFLLANRSNEGEDIREFDSVIKASANGVNESDLVPSKGDWLLEGKVWDGASFLRRVYNEIAGEVPLASFSEMEAHALAASAASPEKSVSSPSQSGGPQQPKSGSRKSRKTKSSSSAVTSVPSGSNNVPSVPSKTNGAPSADRIKAVFNDPQHAARYYVALQVFGYALMKPTTRCVLVTDVCNGTLVIRRDDHGVLLVSHYDFEQPSFLLLFVYFFDSFYHSTFSGPPNVFKGPSSGASLPQGRRWPSLGKVISITLDKMGRLFSRFQRRFGFFWLPVSLHSKHGQPLLSFVHKKSYMSIGLRLTSLSSRQAVVYRSHHLYVKLYRDKGAFDRETQALWVLAKHNVPTIIAKGITDAGRHFAVMTRVGEAFDRELTPDEAREFYDQVLYPIHQHSYHHHDLYPGNITRDADGKFYLIDFGDAVTTCMDPSQCQDLEWLRQHNVKLPTSEQAPTSEEATPLSSRLQRYLTKSLCPV
ncbi:hypothetical protein NMY22_g2005 [Coprinellus aureogranulatus]|nr:hypothetical protein NMY22_g2005 [Coprinellus aureogranulatus]